MKPQPHASGRLDDTLQPVSYVIALDASPQRQEFSGTVRLKGTLSRRSKTVFLHARGLELEDVEVRQGRTRQSAEVEVIALHQMVALHFETALSPGPIDITMPFSGTLSESMHGLYLAVDGPERALVSQCEASDARAIFPCLDEPAFKATFAWEVTTDKGLTVLTNGTLIDSETTGKKTRHRFEKTQKMSTYLAALTIGHFAGGAHQTVGKIPCQIWAGKGKSNQTRFACDITAQVLPWYTTYFGTPYAYKKLDQVAVPGFDAGAMENVGAIFYRQSLLLMKPGQTSWGAEKRIAEVVAHEIAHQWFGNLVTMQWWDDLWLNEAFATFMAYTVCHAIKPDWRIWEDYLEGKEAALGADALTSTHPIYAPVSSPAEATELFDVITYEKGCGVLRMAEAYMGARAFRDGIRRYIKAHRFGNAKGADLWKALTQAAKLPVDKLMHNWVTTPGFPHLSVSATTQKGQPALKIEQRRFLAQPKTQNAPSKTTWLTPVVIAYDAGEGPKEHRALIDRSQCVIPLPAKRGAKLKWAYPNHDATGFYRTQLDDTLMAQIRAEGIKNLSVSSRMSVVSDTWALVRQGGQPVEDILDLVDHWGRQERDPLVLKQLAYRLKAIRAALLPTGAEKDFCRWVSELGTPHLKRLGERPKKGESAPQSVLRAALIDQLGNTARDPQWLKVARQLAAQEAQKPESIDANLAATVVSLSALSGDKRRVDEVVEIYQSRKSRGLPPELTSRYLSALCSFEKPAAVRAALGLTLGNVVPQEQLRVVLSAYLGRRATGELAWAFLKKHWSKLSPRVGSMGISRLVETTGALPYPWRADVLKFFHQHPVPEAERALKKAIEAMDVAQAFRSRASDATARWLERREVTEG